MENTRKSLTDESKMQSLLEALLVSGKTLKSSAGETSFHMDEDSLTAFVEGNLTERESVPLVNHLVNCGFCRHKTAELVRLDADLGGADEALGPVSAAEPFRISDVATGLLAKIFGAADGAVFALNEEDADGETGPGDVLKDNSKKDKG